MKGLVALVLCVAGAQVALAQSAPVSAAPAAPGLDLGGAHLLTLEEALRTAHEREPTLRQSHATTEASAAKVDQARAPLLPQLVGSAGYTHGVGNFALGAGAGAQQTDIFKAGVRADQLIYDFGQTTGKFDAAKATLSAQADNERAASLLVALNVRSAYFSVVGAKALLEVATDTLANQQRHQTQIQGFVEVGTRPEIDLAQARTDVANARLGVIQADGAYRAAKANLNLAMGTADAPDYEVSAQTLAPVEGEDKPTAVLMDEALAQRPEFAGFEQQRRAQEAILRSIDGGYWPTLSASTALNDQGPRVDNLAWNWNAGLNLNWPIFQGGITKGQAREARANLQLIEAKLDALRGQVRVDLDQAWLGVRTAKEARVAADEVVVNARVRLGFAEGRYATGVGNAIELADAQLALSNARAQAVQAVFNLATARAQLLKALGRP